VTSQGQRFRRRALRRGYKVDEVDTFLDRVEATLNGEAAGSPAAAQEVHDVVFRVRFGGYDEWQVDLHLDRVERQLGELEERGGFPARAPERMAPERMAPPPERMPVPERMPPPAPPMRDDRMMPPDRGGPPMRDDRMMPPDRMAPPMREERPLPPPMPARPAAPMPAPAAAGYGRYDEPARYDEPTSSFGGSGGFDAFEPGRHGKMDMTTEMRMPKDLGGGPPPGVGGDAQRVDQLRRTFQPRRFGSGYDPGQVDRLFEGIIAAMSGRAAVPINDNELDPGQFSLVPGGYFEAEVDQALREVRDMMRRR
jgi:DivIVA domain-containing protein